MTSRQFLPPEYIESHWCIFDADTGEVLATETVWIENGAENQEPGPSASLVRQQSVDSTGRHRRVDAIQIDALPTNGPLRVDPARRILNEYTPAASTDSLAPRRLESP